MKGIFSPVDNVREPPVPPTGEDVREPPLPSNNGSEDDERRGRRMRFPRMADNRVPRRLGGAAMSGGHERPGCG